jgi:hypothetical protein
MSNYDATSGEQGWIMKSKLNELRLDAGIARIENQQWLCVLDKETGMMIDPMIGLEKFAELLIQQCCNAIVNDSRLSDVRTARNGCVRAIKEHFGVEE